MSLTLPASLVRGALRCARPLFASRRVPLRVKRELVDVLTAAGRGPGGTSYAQGLRAGVAVQWCVPPGTSGRGVLLYLHGGGYALGSARAYRGVAAQLAARMGVEAVLPDYRRAPEHPFPAALDDALAVYVSLLDDGHDPRRLFIAGDSAGGGLTLALLMRLRDRGIPQPAAAGLISPWLDLRADVEGTRLPSTDPLIVPRMTAEWASPYAGDADPANPLISPLHGTLTDLAPLVIHSAADDPIAVDAARLEARLRDAGLADAVEHRTYPDRWHVFHLQVGTLADAGRALDHMAARLRARAA